MRPHHLAAGVVALLWIALAPARADFLVAPGDRSTAEGGSNNGFPFLLAGGMRYQQVFGASQFAPVGSPLRITAITLRQDQLANQAFNVTLPDVALRLATTARGPDGLDPTFAANLGADATTVRGGGLTLSSADGVGPNGTRAFDVTITFASAFVYDPALGNLLLDVTNANPGSSLLPSVAFDAQNVVGDSVGRVYANDARATSGTADSSGLVVRFTFQPVPEPAGLTLLALGLAGVGWVAGRRRRA